MAKSAVVEGVLEWIESHLEQPLDVTEIAKKSGYSKRAFHSIFKLITGYNIATYVRYRRLSKSATMLLMTQKSIAEIAYLFQFESQAYYTRAFKKYFNQTPAEFRKGNMDFTKHHFAYNDVVSFDNDYVLNVVQVKGMSVEGVMYGLAVKVADIQAYKDAAIYCHDKVKHRVGLASFGEGNIISVISFLPDIKNSDYLSVKYLVGFCNDKPQPQPELESVVIESGRYARISYIGTWLGYGKLTSILYGVVMNNHRLVRADGVDFEIFNTSETDFENVNVEYYIPIG